MTGSLVPTSPTAMQLPKHYKFPKTIGPQAVAKFMPWIELFWHEKKRYPTNTEIMAKFGFTVEQVAKLNSSKFWLQSLDRRGIVRPNFTDKDGTPLELTERQVAAIAVLTNFNDLRPTSLRLAQLGISEEELQGWYSNEVFNKELQSRAEETFGSYSADATVELGRLIKKGDFRAIKFYYEITGKAQSAEAINVRQAMQVLVEAVQKHVKDPETLQAIAAEVQSLRAIKGL